MIYQQSVKTPRLKTTYYRAGEKNKQKLLLVHGNLSSSVFYLPLFNRLSKKYDVVAPDLRCFGDSDALNINAQQGYKDWSDDLKEFTDALGWDRFIFAGWSMGGGIGMQYLLDHPEELEGLVLINPVSPYGFGGTKGIDGKMLKPAGIASGAGLVASPLISAISKNDRDFLKMTLYNTIFFEPGFRLPPVWEEKFIDGISKTKIGPGMYPGDTRQTLTWPFVSTGKRGVCNAMSSLYGNVSDIINSPIKPPILWVRGENDQMISDHSICDLAVIGKNNFFRLPGEEYVRPQPMISQTRYVLDRYEAKGGHYKEIIIPGAHCCIIESPDLFSYSLDKFISGLS